MGIMTPEEVLAKIDDPVVGRMKVKAFVSALPGYGKVKTEKLMEELGIPADRRLQGLGSNQMKSLLEAIALTRRKHPEARADGARFLFSREEKPPRADRARCARPRPPAPGPRPDRRPGPPASASRPAPPRPRKQETPCPSSTSAPSTTHGSTPYARLTEAQLRSKLEPANALFIAESGKVIERAFAGGMEPMSLLMEEKWVESMTPLIEQMERAHPDLAVLVAPREELARLTGSS